MVTRVQSEARDAIMQSIRVHLAESAGMDHDHSPPPPVSTNPVNAVPDNGEVAPQQRFCERLESVGGHCIIAHDEDDAAQALASVLAGLQDDDLGKRIALSDAPILSRLTRGIGAAEITVGPSVSDLFNYDVGITTAQAAIAETGTLVLEAEKEQHRLISLLPPVHIALVRARDIYPTIADALKRLRDEEQMSRAITFITGPSRTADIELTLTVGVHGPKELHVVVLEDWTNDSLDH